MKFGLFAKLFFTILLTTATVIVGMAISVHWSFRYGLESYLHQTEIEQLDKLVPILEKFYAEHTNWESLRHNRPLFHRILRSTFNDDKNPFLPPEIEDNMPPPFPPKFSPPPRNLPINPAERPPPPPSLPRLRVLDAERQPVIGPPHVSPHEIFRPIIHQGKIVGWLTLRPSDIITDKLALQFQTQQSRSYYLIATLAVIISALVSLFLVRHLLYPIQRITAGARALGSGIYQTRVSVKSNDELGQLAHDFNQLAYTLERNEQARRQWIADISHELRTPLAILRGEIEAIQDGIYTPNREVLKSLHNEVLGLSKLVDDLYELTLSDLGALNYRKESVNLIELLDETVTAYQPRFIAKSILLQNHTTLHKPLYIFADAQRLTQLFKNLLENSLRYTDTNGKVEISLQLIENHVILDFQDSAPGVPEAALDKLFERLYRVDPSRSRLLGGTGLGLAICRNIVEAHEGKISALQSALGGLKIRVQFNNVFAKTEDTVGRVIN